MTCERQEGPGYVSVARPPRISQSGRRPHRGHPRASAAAPPGYRLLCLLLPGCPAGPQGQVNVGPCLPDPTAQAMGGSKVVSMVSFLGWR